MTDTTRPDHAARIREFCDELRTAGSEDPLSPDYRFMRKAADIITDNLAIILRGSEGLAAENAALRAALREMAGEIASHRRRGYPDNIERDRQSLYKEFGIAHLFDAEGQG